jgi:hypothetical protein
MVNVQGVAMCYECNLRLLGKPTTEGHHLFGKRNSPLVVTLFGNLHRVLSERQLLWSSDTLRNPRCSARTAEAAALLGLRDIVVALFDLVILPIVERLEKEDA